MVLHFFLLKAKLVDVTRIHLRPAISVALRLLGNSLIFLGFGLRGTKVLMQANRTWLHDKDIQKLAHSDLALRLNSEINATDVRALMLRRSIVLKAPRLVDRKVIEKGVLLLKFTETSTIYVQKMRCEELKVYFQIVLEPSWTGYCLPEFFRWSALGGGNTFIEALHPDDIRFVELLERNVQVIRRGSGNWVDERVFLPLDGTEKKFDSIIVANYQMGKRLHRFLSAIRSLKRIHGDYHAAIVCSTMGEGRAQFMNILAKWKLEPHVTVFEDVKQPKINELFNCSKVNVLLSLKEGTNRALIEGLFANTPGLAISESFEGSKEQLVAGAGLVVKDKKLESALIHFRDHWQDYNPREYAMQQLSAARSTEIVNEALRQDSLNEGFPWTQDIVQKINIPEARYRFTADKDRLERWVSLLPLFEKSERLDVELIRQKVSEMADSS